jgi:xylulokinase
MHEQMPEDWWRGVVKSTRTLLAEAAADGSEIACLSLSGHSCVAVPIDREGVLMSERVPIWSDTRATEDAEAFFRTVDEKDWYRITGNGFPVACYYLFKLMWLKRNQPELYEKIDKVVGSKDYINYRLTGRLCTDYSYASSSGAYDLTQRRMRAELIGASGIRADLFPELVPSHTVIGGLTKAAAEELGLLSGTPVACGGVDNACMALGAVGTQEGAVYVSLGSSSWIPVNSARPVLDYETKPYVFAHIDETMFTSAYSIFAGGSSYLWARETLCKDLDPEGIFAKMDELAAGVPVGSNGILFNPSLAGGTSQDKSINIRGAFLGLHLGSTREDMIRAALEGITLNLRMSLELLSRHVSLTDRLLICGGGSKSPFLMQMFADGLNREILKTNVDQDAASLGAAAICARAMGLWQDYSRIPGLHVAERVWSPDETRNKAYEAIYPAFIRASELAADLGDYMAGIRG